MKRKVFGLLLGITSIFALTSVTACVGDVKTSSESIPESSIESSDISSAYYTDGLIFALNDDQSYSVTGYTGLETEVVIPSVYENLPVTSIGNRAFYSCGNFRLYRQRTGYCRIGQRI